MAVFGGFPSRKQGQDQTVGNLDVNKTLDANAASTSRVVLPVGTDRYAV